MIYSSRLKKILQICLERDGYVTVDELSTCLKTSRRTIFRELQDIDKELEEYHVALLSTQGKGICIEGNKEDKEALRKELSTQGIQYLHKEERRNLLIFELLRSDEVQKLLHYANLFQVSEATISNDLDSIEPWFHDYELTLLRKPGVGVEIQGEEAQVRMAMTNILQERLWKMEGYDQINYLDSQTLLQKIFLKQGSGIMKMLNQDILERILEVFHTYQHELNLDRYAQTSYIGLIIHLVIAIERILKNEELQEGQEIVGMMKEDASFAQAQAMAHVLETEFDIDIPEVEVAFIALHIKGAKISKIKEREEDSGEVLSGIIQAMLACYDADKAVLLQQDEELFQGLLTHLEPTIIRLMHHLPIYNPLLQQIQREYHDLYEQTAAACKVLETTCGCAVSADEIGFLTMHIGASLERMSQKQQQRRSVTIGVVCASGIGISAMLSARIAKSFPKEAILYQLSMEDLLEGRYEHCELLLSTMDISVADRSVLRISPLLTRQDIQTIQQQIEVLQQQSPRHAQKEGLSDFQQQLQLLKEISTYSLVLLQNIHSYTIQETSLPDIITRSAQLLGDEDTWKQIEADLWKREAQGSLVMKELHFALLHARSAMDHMAVALLYPQTCWAKEWQDIDVIIVMLLPANATQVEKELLSVISRGLIDNEDFLLAIRSQDNAALQQQLHQLLQEYIEESIPW